MSKFVDLAEKLSKIPHLYVGSYDIEKLQTELASIDPALFVPFRSKSRHTEYLAKFWHGLSLVAPGGSIHGDLTEEGYAGRTDSQWTPVAEQSPYIKEVITDLGGEGQRVRLMCVRAGGSFPWHRHGTEIPLNARGMRPNWYEVIVHVPVKSNPQVSYEVIEASVYELSDYSAGIEIHKRNYPEGEAWVFNAAHYHNVFNRSQTEDRYSIMLTLDIRMRKTFDIVSKAVERYEGPLLTRL
jgi:hypothetical protein